MAAEQKTPLRCHLLIGPPSSGKTTIAEALALRINGRIASTDAIRTELFGDEAVQGYWKDVEATLHERIYSSVADGVPMVVDATHAKRTWRLSIIQALALPAEVDWVGWWMKTPLATCLQWNLQRNRSLPETVIRRYSKGLADRSFGPGRDEGFAVVIEARPDLQEIDELLTDELSRLDRRICSGRNRQKNITWHGHSRLLDFERLLYLIRLLSHYPDLATTDESSATELASITGNQPTGDLADRAAIYLSALHGDCYGNSELIRRDLHWLEQQGFTDLMAEEPAIVPLETGEAPPCGGCPWIADAAIFSRVMTLLRHILRHPFDKERGKDLHEHLAAGLEGSYLPTEAKTLRKDIQLLLSPYGFRSENDNVRHGFAIGTAVLSAGRLRETLALIQQASGRLEDPSAQDLLTELQERLRWGGIAEETHSPVRMLSNRSIVSNALVQKDCLVHSQQAERLEHAIIRHCRVTLSRYDTAGSFDASQKGTFQAWPLQLIFHNIGWYLIYEDDFTGRPEGLIRSERLDRLKLQRAEVGDNRNNESHKRSLDRSHRLMELSGSIFFGTDLEDQLELAKGSLVSRTRMLTTLRFTCQPWCFAFIREGLQRFPINNLRFSKRLPGDTWWHHQNAPHVLEHGEPQSSYPYPVEIDLPLWTIENDIDLKRWLFGFGNGIRIESPPILREQHQQHASSITEMYTAD